MGGQFYQAENGDIRSSLYYSIRFNENRASCYHVPHGVIGLCPYMSFIHGWAPKYAVVAGTERFVDDIIRKTM